MEKEKVTSLSDLGGVILIDGDYFKRTNCLIFYRDHPGKRIVFWRWSSGEYLWEIASDLIFLLKQGYPLKGIISDGKPSLALAAEEIEKRYFLPKNKVLPHQRCLVHLQLRVNAFLTKKPKTQAGKELKELSLFINQIKNHYQKEVFILWFKRWEKRHCQFLKQKSWGIDSQTGRKYWWYTHRYLRRAWRLIKNALPSMFVYLDYPYLCKDTNALEGYFSQLDSIIKRHRGLKREKLPKLISWYLLLKHCPNIKLQDIKKLRL